MRFSCISVNHSTSVKEVVKFKGNSEKPKGEKCN